MNADELVEQLLDHGMTEQQIADLVAQQVIRSRGGQPSKRETAERAETTASDQKAPGHLPDGEPDSTSNGEASLAFQPGVAEIVGKVAERLERSSVDPQVLYGAGAVTESVLMLSERFAGPMPSPRHAQLYENILPGFTDRCLAIHENNSQAMRDRLARSDQRLDRGQVFALIFALACLLSGLGFAALGYGVVGATVSTTTLVSVVGAFLYKKRKTRRRKRPRESLTPAPDSGENIEDTQDSVDGESEH